MTAEETDSPPGISIVIPTLNSEKTLGECLQSIREQDYPGQVEIVVADGGSADRTVEIAEGYGCLVVENSARTGEAGKARGLKEAHGEIIAFIDSDNILPDRGWLTRMTGPFADPAIAGTEPLEYVLRPGDPVLTRYCALLGMNDPLCYFLGNYDRMSALSGRWTGLDVEATDRGGYLELRLEEDALPTMGANGFLARKRLLDLLDIGDYLFDIDVIYELVRRGHNRFAKVKTGIVHLYGRGLSGFARKQLRRVRDFQYYSSIGVRKYPWSRQKKAGLARFVLYCLLVFPLMFQSIKGYLRRPDSAWLMHVPACLVTLAVYGWGFLESRIRPREQERAGWSQ